jgi:hypothetical protein
MLDLALCSIDAAGLVCSRQIVIPRFRWTPSVSKAASA